MMIIELLTNVNNSYLVALAALVYLIIEGLKASESVSVKLMPLVAAVIGWGIGLAIAVIYQESLVLTSLNGVIAGLLAAGSFDFMKALWRLPESLK